MRLFIAEKPELAKAIVEGLGGGSRQDGYFECGGDTVTWCFGHMLELYEPHDYDEALKRWSLDTLPWSCVPWKKKPIAKSKKQLRVVLDLLKKASSVVHAGDPDEEGQLLVDEILDYAKWSGATQRVLINDNNTKVVRRALDNMQDNAAFQGLSARAEARSVGDLLYGVNLTRAYTLIAQQAGYQDVLSVGRVQTPILGLVVRRDREHEAHTKSYYYIVRGEFECDGALFKAAYLPTEGDDQDEKGRLTDQQQAEAIAQAVNGKQGKLARVAHKEKRTSAPLPYNLLKLQTDASRKFGFKPDKVKEITQSLREKHRLITYNRSDCQYLSEEQHADAPAVLDAISQTAKVLAGAAGKANPQIKGRAFNSNKVSAHHAIIPTETVADLEKLTDGEKKIYQLIARSYIAQFFPDFEYTETTLQVDVEGRQFRAVSNTPTAQGWKVLYRNDQDNEEVQGDDDAQEIDLRTLNQGAAANCKSAKAEQKETQPPKRYTMATLLTDLTRVAKYVNDPSLRKVLQEKDKEKAGEHGGIGTPATRDTMIETLFKRGYLAEQGKSIVSTAMARSFYDALPDQAKYPDMTAIWHQQQEKIEAGELPVEAFLDELMQYIGGQIESSKQDGLKGLKIDVHKCPECSRPLARRPGSNGPFWGCTGFKEGACKATFPDKKGKPDLNKSKPSPSQKHKCMSCGKGLIRRTSTRGKKKSAFWGCSGFPDCKQSYPDLKGKPNYSKPKE